MSGGGARSGGKGGGNPVIPNPNAPTSGATPVAGTGQSYEDVVAAGGGGINPNGMYTSNFNTFLPIGTGAFDPSSGIVGPATGAGNLFNNLLNTTESVTTPPPVTTMPVGDVVPVTGAEPTTTDITSRLSPLPTRPEAERARTSSDEMGRAGLGNHFGPSAARRADTLPIAGAGTSPSVGSASAVSAACSSRAQRAHRESNNESFPQAQRPPSNSRERGGPCTEL